MCKDTLTEPPNDTLYGYCQVFASLLYIFTYCHYIGAQLLGKIKGAQDLESLPYTYKPSD